MDVNRSRTLLLMLMVSLSSLLLFADARRPGAGLLMKLCERTTNPAVCSRTISPFIHGGADPVKALEIEVDATLGQTKKTVAIIANLLANHDNSKQLNDALNICKDQYDSIADSIKETKDAIAKHNVIEAKYKFSAVLSFQSSCKDAFEGSLFPFANDSDAIYQLGGNCLDIIAEIEKAMGPPKQVPAQSTPSPFRDVIGTIS